jgi:hypothetical protein
LSGNEAVFRNGVYPGTKKQLVSNVDAAAVHSPEIRLGGSFNQAPLESRVHKGNEDYLRHCFR